jgi:menaquinone-9 beta-reductase
VRFVRSSVVDADVAVVGAGPAGCAAAITLARGGRDVVVVERATLPRDKCCGDGLTAAALRLLEELGVAPGSVPSWLDVHEVAVRSPGGRERRFPLPRGSGTFAAVARRRDLDATLTRTARASGAEVAEAEAVEGVSLEEDRVVLHAAGAKRFEARFVVAADGVWSRVRKVSGAAEPDGYRGEWHALRQYVRNVSPTASSAMWVLFEADLLPGYAWSFPLPDGRANVGLGVKRKPAEAMGELGRRFAALLRRPHVERLLGADAEPVSALRSWPIPARSSCLTALGGRILFAGDAARVGDPMTGEGVAQALASGMLAAKAIEGGWGDDPEIVARAYGRAVRRLLAVDSRFAGLLSHLLARPGGAEGALFVAGAGPFARERFARWLMEDMPRAVVLTPARWHKGALGGPGAYR